MYLRDFHRSFPSLLVSVPPHWLGQGSCCRRGDSFPTANVELILRNDLAGELVNLLFVKKFTNNHFVNTFH